MAKAKPKIADKSSAMERILGLQKPEVSETPTPEAKEPKAQEPPEKGRAAKKESYVQTAFYITKEQHKALKIRAARGDNPEEKDMSAITRAALDKYLGL